MSSKTSESERSIQDRLNGQLASAMDSMRFGRAHRLIIALIAIGTVFDAIEQFNIGYAAPAISKLWGLSSTQVGFLSTATFGGVALGCLLAGAAGDIYGRKITYLYNLALYSLGALIGALAPNYWVLLLGRVVVGIGLGGELNIGVTIISEMVPTRVRGACTALVNVAGGGVGIFLSAALAWLMLNLLGGFFGGPDTSWRWMLGVLVLPALLVFVYRRYMPESPRYLLIQGRIDQTNRVLTLLDAGRLRDDGRQTRSFIDRADDGELARERVNLLEIFSSGLRRRTTVLWLISFMAFGAQDTITIFMPSILVKEGYAIANSLTFTMIINAGGLVGALLAVAGGHFLRRRPLLCAGALAAIASAIGFVNAHSIQFVLVFGFIFQTLSMLLTTLIWVYAPELYPSRVRAFGVGTSVMVASMAGSLIPPIAGNVLDQGGAFALFAFVGAMYVLMAAIIWLGPETQGKSLEEISETESADGRNGEHTNLEQTHSQV